MKNLFIFDSTVRIEGIPCKQLTQQDEIYLFPLSSKTEISRKIKNVLTQVGTEVHLLPSADLLNKSAESIRSAYIKLIAEFPDKVKVDNQNLKEWFAVDRTLSLWWLSLVSEKNTLKSEFFNKLVQLDSIVEVIKEKEIKRIFFGCREQPSVLGHRFDLRVFEKRLSTKDSTHQALHRSRRHLSGEFHRKLCLWVRGLPIHVLQRSEETTGSCIQCLPQG